MHRYTRIALAAALFISAGVMIARQASAAAQPRELRLVVRDMTFYLEGKPEPNPDLKFKAGEEVRVVLVNEDEGMRHNFRIPAWDAGTRLVRGKGEVEAVFKVPEARQETRYVCAPHQKKMNGRVIVE
jgi:hypothetical protein